MLIRGMGYMSAGIYNPFNPTAALPTPAGTPPAALTSSGAAAGGLFGAATLVAQAAGSAVTGAAAALSQLAAVASMAAPPPAPVPPPSITAGPSLAATGAAVPIGAAVVVGSPTAKGPNEQALDAAMAAAGVVTDDQAATWLTSLDGQPAPQFLDETSSAYYLSILAKNQQEATYLKWGIGAALLIGAGVLVLK